MPASKRADAHESVSNGARAMDRLLEHRSRLGICVLLLRADAMSFSRLKTLLDETDGNLGAHLKKLEEAGYIRVRKEFADRKPVSWYGLTTKGETATRAHLEALEELLQGAER